MGNQLFNEVIEFTGLPRESISKELRRLLLLRGLDPNKLTLEELRVFLSDFLDEIALGEKEQ